MSGDPEYDWTVKKEQSAVRDGAAAVGAAATPEPAAMGGVSALKSVLRGADFEQGRALVRPGGAGGSEQGHRPPRGDRGHGQKVRRLQSKLNLVAERYGKLAGTPLGVDGVAGPKTHRATRSFQAAAGRFVPGARLAVDGVAGPRTLAALDRALAAPAGDQEAVAVPGAAGQVAGVAEAGASTAETHARSAGGASPREAVEARGTTEEVPTAEGIAQEIPSPETPLSHAQRALGVSADPKLKTALRKLRRWTYAKMKQPDRIAARILTAKPHISRWAFFHAYWRRRCWQFASRLLLFAGYTNLMKATAQTKLALESGGEAPATRSTAFRGMTLAELGSQPGLVPGSAVHVKMEYDKDPPYHEPDDFHHWVVYVGAGQFTDSHNVVHDRDAKKWRNQPFRPGATIDAWLQGWVKRGFGSSGRGHHYEHLYNARFAKPESLEPSGKRRRPKPAPKSGLQPRVTEVYLLDKRGTKPG